MARIPPRKCCIDKESVPSDACTTPDINKPRINAKPLRTDPAYFVTRPTTIPPIAFVVIGIIVVNSHL